MIEGDLPPTDADRRRLRPEDLRAGWRLACQARASSDLSLEIGQWEETILGDDERFAFRPESGLGVAVDLGTTTLVAQLVDLETGAVLAVRSGINPQARHGADVMSRVHLAVTSEEGARRLTRGIRDAVGRMVEELLRSDAADPGALRRIAIVGNTVMHHLFCGLDVAPLSAYPFRAEQDGLVVCSPDELAWPVPADVEVRFLPCLGGFVGSDVLAGIIATSMAEADGVTLLVDLGTNGEVVVGGQGRLLCASTAAGPAFEGARIEFGMRASTGAISHVRQDGDRMVCQVVGGGTPKGICGSGLVDAVALAARAGRLEEDGRIRGGDTLPLSGRVVVTQKDIRELQLAKAAIAAGIRILLERLDAGPDSVSRVWLAGAFGNYVSRSSARRIGLLPFREDLIIPAGNTALRGAKMALFRTPGAPGEGAVDRSVGTSWDGVRQRVEHVALGADATFQSSFIDEMGFPVDS